MSRSLGTPAVPAAPRGPAGERGPAGIDSVVPGPPGDPGVDGTDGLPGVDGSPDTAAEVLSKIVTVDGAGSGLDADLLDGLHATAFATPASLATAVATHEADTTAVHGIADTSLLVLTGDSRLADARTPTAHAASHTSGGTDAITISQSQVTSLTADLAARALTSDARFTDARTPTGAAGGVLGGTYPNPGFAADMATQAELDAHVIATGAHAATKITNTPAGTIAATTVQAALDELDTEKMAKAANLSDVANVATARGSLGLGAAALLAIGTTAGTAAAGDDSRFTNARTPTAHAASHASGGSDAVTIAESQVTGLTADLAAKLALAGGTITGALTLNGNAPQLTLASGTSNWITLGAAGAAAPTFTTRSAGTKLVLYDGLTGASADYALGIEANVLWTSVPTTAASWKWYGGTTLAATLTGVGALTLVGNLTVPNVVVGSSFLIGTNPASTGALRLPNNTALSWRNAANNADLALNVSTANVLTYPGGMTLTGGAFRTDSGVSLIRTDAGDAILRVQNTSQRWDSFINSGDAHSWQIRDITNGRTPLLLRPSQTWSPAISIDVNGVNFADGMPFLFGTTTGTTIGTSTAHKLAFWSATPVVQPTTAVAAATFVAGAGTAVNDASTFDGYTLKQIVKALRTIGVLA